MRALIQRVSEAKVQVADQTVGQCGQGLLVFVCAMQDDTPAHASKLAAKLVRMRIFRDENGKMNRSLVDIGGSALVISQFTLAGDTSRGNRPGFSAAAAPDLACTLYEQVAEEIASHGIPVETGQFGADMKVSLTNDGPVTLWVEST